jgi:hypothetical protein
MNKLKKLFSPSTLAATAATGMLLASAVVAVADEVISVEAYSYPITCQSGWDLCSLDYYGQAELHYCCPTTDPASTCAPNDTYCYSYTYMGVTTYICWCVST